MKPFSDKDVLQAYLDGQLTDEQVRGVESRLRTDPDLANKLLVLSREEAILSEWACSRAVTAETRQRNSEKRRRSQRLRLAGWLVPGVAVAAAAALVLIVFRSGIDQPPEPRKGPAAAQVKTEKQPEPVILAKLEDIQGEVMIVPETGEPFAAQAGQSLLYGQSLRTQGEGSFAVVAFADASRLELGADTTIRLGDLAAASTTDSSTAGTKVYLLGEEGSVSADVSPQPEDRPIVLVTPHAETRLGGSKANFTALPKGTRIEQEKGKVQVTRKSDGRSIDMTGNSFAVASQGAEQFASQPLSTQITQARAVLNEGTGPIHAAAFSPTNSNLLATSCNDGSIKLWDVATGTVRETLRGHRKPVKALAFSPDGRLLASGSEEKQVKFWDPATGKEVGLPLKNFKGAIHALAFSPDGTLLATGGGHHKNAPEIKLCLVASRVDVATLAGHTGTVLAVAFSRDGKLLATAGKDGAVKLWDVATREVRQTLTGHSSAVNTLAFSPDGALLATGGKDLTIKLWNTSTWTDPRTLQGHGSEIRSLTFSPDGKTLAAADHNVKLWDLASGRERVTLKANKFGVSAVAYAPNGKTIATAGSDKSILLWNPPAETATESTP